MKRIITYCVLAVLFVGTIWVAVKQSPSPSKSKQLVLGTVGGYAPFVSVNAQGEYEGFDVDVAKALAKQMDKELILKDLGSMTSLFMALAQGSIDGAIWALSITSKRLERVAMVNYQGEVTQSYPLIFWKKIPAGVANISDMKGMIVCVEPNSSQGDVLNKYGFITIKPTEKVDDALLNIQYGKADAAFVEPAIATKFKNKYPEIQILDVMLAPEDQVQGIGIAIRKDKTDFIDQVEKAVAQLKRDGIIKSLEQKWEVA